MLLNPGYWPTTYWANSYWSDRYWPSYIIEAEVDIYNPIAAISKLHEVSAAINKSSNVIAVITTDVWSVVIVKEHDMKVTIVPTTYDAEIVKRNEIAQFLLHDFIASIVKDVGPLASVTTKDVSASITKKDVRAVISTHTIDGTIIRRIE